MRSQHISGAGSDLSAVELTALLTVTAAEHAPHWIPTLHDALPDPDKLPELTELTGQTLSTYETLLLHHLSSFRPHTDSGTEPDADLLADVRATAKHAVATVVDAALSGTLTFTDSYTLQTVLRWAADTDDL